MVFRLVMGILAVTFLPIGVLFVILGLAIDNPSRGEPGGLVWPGVWIGLAGVVLTIVFVVLWRREAARKRRRRAGLRANAEVVGVRLRPNVRSSGSIAMDLTVRDPTGTGTVTGTFFVIPTLAPAEGAHVEILYDPAEPSNFEPVPDPRYA